MWDRDLAWSFEPTRRRIEDARTDGVLDGLVAYDDIGACGYATYAVDGRRGIIGSVFSAARVRPKEVEGLLVERILRRLALSVLETSPLGNPVSAAPTIDCQTLFTSARDLTWPFRTMGFSSAARIYMDLPREAWRRPKEPVRIAPTSKRFERADLKAAAKLVFDAHSASSALDASSSFDTVDSCERILRQIVLDEVCGSFDPAGSQVARLEGEVAALTILTWPAPGVAHLSEVATAPAFQRRGLGRYCLSEALTTAFAQQGATRATLSVTASNRPAVVLYESMGFRPRVGYLSHLWRGQRP